MLVSTRQSPNVKADLKSKIAVKIIEITSAMSNNITETVEKEREEARAVCDTSGATSPECAAAWDAVEEVQAEASHQKQVKPKNSLEVYCDDNPDAVECRLYED